MLCWQQHRLHKTGPRLLQAPAGLACAGMASTAVLAAAHAAAGATGQQSLTAVAHCCEAAQEHAFQNVRGPCCYQGL
jgi:hypothetical protein